MDAGGRLRTPCGQEAYRKGEAERGLPVVSPPLGRLELPPCSRLLGWRVLDARPEQGWVRIGFDGNAKFCNPAGFIQGGILTAMLDDTMGPAVFVMTEGRLYTATITMTVNFLAPAKV